MIFDPILSELLDDEGAETNGITWQQRPLCNHCYRRIEGKVYLSNNKYYDSYCWGLRAIIENEESQSKNRSNANPLNRNNIKSK